MHPDIFQFIPAPGKGYVYHITSGSKHYIGISTTAWSKRWKKHCAPDSGCVKLVRQLNRLRAIGKWNQLNVQILQQAKNQSLDKLQKKYIKKFGSFKSIYGMNSTPGGRDTTPSSMKAMKVFKRSKRKVNKQFKQTKTFSWQSV